MDSATVSQVLRRYAPQYLERFGDDMPLQQKKVLQAVTACRTGLLGVVRYACAQCGKSHVMGRSCGNRHCVLCQADKSKAWLAKQEAKLLPCHYFRLLTRICGEILVRGGFQGCDRGWFQRLRRSESRTIFWWSILLCC